MYEETERERERDWSDLPSEVVHIISKRIHKLCGFICFRAICKRWHSSIPLSDAPPQLPWLLEGNGDSHAITINLHDEHHFYSLFTGEIGTIYVKPSCQGKGFRGPSYGHLLLWDKGYTNVRKSCHLFNPLTGEEFSLPPQPSPTGWPPVHNYGFESWAFYDAQNSEWIAAERRFSHSCCYHGGMIFSSRGGACTEIFGVSGSKLYEIAPPLQEIQIRWPPTSYLVESAGQLLRVSLYLKCSEHSYFRIYKTAFDGRNCVWVEISSIGDQVLFLDVVDGFSISAELFRAGGGLTRGNFIYFLHPDNCQPYRYDIQDGSVQKLPCPFQNCTWFVPTLRTMAT